MSGPTSLPPVAVPVDRTTPDGVPKLFRSRTDSVVGGVSGGLARHLNISVGWIRAIFVLLAIMGGAGVLAYALLWIFVPIDPGYSESAPEETGRDRRQAFGIAALGLALMIGAGALGLNQTLGWVLGPLGLAAVGGALIWREADETRRARWRRTAAGMARPGGTGWWRLIGGLALVVGGLAVFLLGQLDLADLRSTVIAVLLTLVGVGIITVPWWVRLMRDLGSERQGRIREKERAEIAAHLHDSVLQTLALIQRQAGDAREVQRLARGQERELRTWLYGPTGYATSGAGQSTVDTKFATAIATAVGEIEDTYAVAITPVLVGDADMNPHLAALVAAAREAMVNAAKHAGVPEISVYAEVEDGVASVFVRDRGAGFDPTDVEADRRGLAESIRGRMERHGGKAIVRSTPGTGTEIELTMPLQAEQGTQEQK